MGSRDASRSSDAASGSTFSALEASGASSPVAGATARVRSVSDGVTDPRPGSFGIASGTSARLARSRVSRTSSSVMDSAKWSVNAPLRRSHPYIALVEAAAGGVARSEESDATAAEKRFSHEFLRDADRNASSSPFCEKAISAPNAKDDL